MLPCNRADTLRPVKLLIVIVLSEEVLFRSDLVSHDEYPRSHSGKATTCYVAL
jgi:hypothetical protein